MSDQQSQIVAACRALGIDRGGLESIRNFIKAGLYHVGLEGSRPADKHLAVDNAVRRATNRIACQGGHGDSRGMSRRLSAGAVRLREDILADETIPPRLKFASWRLKVTEEHHEPVAVVEDWILKGLTHISVDDIVQRLLTHPSAIVTVEENRRISGAHRSSGTPAERYESAGIALAVQGESSIHFFDRALQKRGSKRVTKYAFEREEFPD